MTQSTTADDADWIRATVQRHEGPLVHFVHRTLGDFERARDVVQEVFLRLCEQPRESVEGHVVEWLFRVARNRALDVQRKEGRMTLVDAFEVNRSDENAPDPSRGMEERENRSQVFATLEHLPERQREALRLKFQHDLSYKQIGAVLDTSVGNVGYLIHVGIRSLRERLGEGQLEGTPS